MSVNNNNNHSRTVADQYVACRSWMHAWEFTTVERSGGEYIQGMRCLRCPTEKTVRINARTGMREHGSTYKYPEQLDPNAAPYQMPKDSGGALTSEERGEIMLQFVGAGDMLRKRRARKKA